MSPRESLVEFLKALSLVPLGLCTKSLFDCLDVPDDALDDIIELPPLYVNVASFIRNTSSLCRFSLEGL